MIKANNPQLTSWVSVPANSDFPIQNLPFGIIYTPERGPRVASRIGDFAVDLSAMAGAGWLTACTEPETLRQSVLNDFIALGQPVWRAVRDQLSDLLSSANQDMAQRAEMAELALIPVAEVQNLLPVRVGDYTDFYSSREHATNVGIMFRGKDNALMPNWLHIPIGYHGRSSSIVISGTPLHRPKGQMKPEGAEVPVYGPSRLLDFELEMAFVIGKSTALGSTISTTDAEDHIFGLALFNDWSARDIQAWEYVPLGPFLGKNFGSSVSPWIVTLDALAPFRIPGPVQDPMPLPYLQYEGAKRFEIELEVALVTDAGVETTISRSNFRNMYWNMAQQLAHHTVNGCNVNVGDMMASGTISGQTEDSYGSMLELTWRGAKPLKLNDGSERKFIQDGDSIIMRGFGQKDGIRIGFGEVSGKILPAT